MEYVLLNENRSKITGAVLCLLVLTVALLGYQLTLNQWTGKNDRALEEELARITYTEDMASEELERLEPFTRLSPASEGARGKLYRALAEISYMTGDEMLYNQYAAYALYYLDNIGDDVSCAYVTNKYIGRLYSNGCYQAADDLLMDLAQRTDIAALPLDLQASYYLSRADIAQMLKTDDGAFVSLAQAAISLMPEGGNRKLNQAKLDLLTVRALIEERQWVQAWETLNGYAETDDFGLGRNQVYVVCDFRIPYYEMRTKLALFSHDDAAVDHYLQLYIRDCNTYKFRAMKLRLLSYLVTHQVRLKRVKVNTYQEMVEQVSRENMRDMTDRYGQFLLTDLEANRKDVSALEDRKAQTRGRVLLLAAAGYAAALLFCLFNLLVSYIHKDGLTRLSSRRQYEKIRIHCERRHIPYCLIMLDIDDFKKVNDSFGHERGDEVLRAISKILQSYSGRGVFAYRYGGEELCVMLLRVPEKRSREIAEEIRGKVETTAGGPDLRVTVSIGVGCSKAGENVFCVADRKLYEAKAAGKNQVR